MFPNKVLGLCVLAQSVTYPVKTEDENDQDEDQTTPGAAPSVKGDSDRVIIDTNTDVKTSAGKGPDETTSDSTTQQSTSTDDEGFRIPSNMYDYDHCETDRSVGTFGKNDYGQRKTQAADVRNDEGDPFIDPKYYPQGWYGPKLAEGIPTGESYMDIFTREKKPSYAEFSGRLNEGGSFLHYGQNSLWMSTDTQIIFCHRGKNLPVC